MNTTSSAPPSTAPPLDSPSSRLGKISASRLWRAFVAGFAAFLTGHWIATQVFHAMEGVEWLKHKPERLVFLATVGACVLWWFLLRVHWRWPRLDRVRGAAYHYGLAILLFCVGVWCALAAEQWLIHGPFASPSGRWVFVSLSCVGLAAFSYWLFREQHHFERPRDVELLVGRLRPAGYLSRGTHFQHLILFVSTPSIVPRVSENPQQEGYHAQLCDESRLLVCNLAGDSLTDEKEHPDLNKLRWNWQQLMRALEPHQGLQKVWLIGSRDAPGYQPPPLDSEGNRPELQSGYRPPFDSGKGSHDYLPLCARFLQHYLRRDQPSARVEIGATVANFEDFNGLIDAVRNVLHHELEGVNQGRILLDVTGGQKVTSIAGAALTLSNELRFQYVQTSKPFRVYRYDVILERLPSFHGHS